MLLALIYFGSTPLWTIMPLSSHITVECLTSSILIPFSSSQSVTWPFKEELVCLYVRVKACMCMREPLTLQSLQMHSSHSSVHELWMPSGASWIGQRTTHTKESFSSIKIVLIPEGNSIILKALLQNVKSICLKLRSYTGQWQWGWSGNTALLQSNHRRPLFTLLWQSIGVLK